MDIVVLSYAYHYDMNQTMLMICLCIILITNAIINTTNTKVDQNRLQCITLIG